MSEKIHLIHQKYRPDIDGLRSLAILPVVLFHAFPGLIPGGFVGVDIFFVISGYLISTIIFSSLEHNRFSILGFYVRRIRRIFPALILVLLVTLLAGWGLLFYFEFRDIGLHVLASAGFFQNFILWQEVGYFDNPASTKPLLHMWSLSVEEQFYIFWPLLLAFVWQRKWRFITITIAIAIISFSLNIFLTYWFNSSAFYLPFPRFWELMIGGALAYIHLHHDEPRCRYPNINASIGLLLIGIALFVINDESRFPGWWAAIPVFGAAFIIHAGQGAWINNVLLSSKLLVGVGLISYPLYLWHWPILAYLRIVIVDPSFTLILISLLLAIILSIATYYFIEKPFRFKGNPGKKALSLLIIMIVTALAGMVIWKENGRFARLNNDQLNFLSQQNISRYVSSRVSDGSCERYNNIAAVKEEVCLSTSSQPEVLFIGDSHAMALFSSIFAGEIRLKAILIAGHSCSMYPNLRYEPTYKQPWGNNCTQIARHALYIADKFKSIKSVVLVNIYDIASDARQYHLKNKTVSGLNAFISGHAYLVRKLYSLNKKVTFVKDVPMLRLMPAQCVNRLSFISANSCDIDLMTTKQDRKVYDAGVNILSRLFPGMKVFNSLEYLCDTALCKSRLNGKWLYQDDDHLSIYGSKYLLSNMLDDGYLK